MQSLGLLPEQRTSSLAQDPRGLKERRREKEHARAPFLLWSHPQWNPKAQTRAGTILQIGRGGFRPASHTPRQKSLPVSSSLCLKFNDPGPSHSLSFIFLSLSLCLPHSLTHFPPSLPLSLSLSLSVSLTTLVPLSSTLTPSMTYARLSWTPLQHSASPPCPRVQMGVLSPSTTMKASGLSRSVSLSAKCHLGHHSSCLYLGRALWPEALPPYLAIWSSTVRKRLKCP